VLNEAVLHSFESDGVRLVDHHQAGPNSCSSARLSRQRIG